MLQHQNNKIHFTRGNSLFIHNFETSQKMLNNLNLNLQNEYKCRKHILEFLFIKYQRKKE